MDGLISNLFIFILATFLGIEVIKRVSPLLHTPLMSLTNAISAISLVGSLTILGRAETNLSIILGAIAVVASMTNVVSGFLITDRMLKMFKSRNPGAAHGYFFPFVLLAAIGTGQVDLGSHTATDISYLIASGLFVMSLKWMNHPTTAKKSVLAGEVAMGLAICGTVLALLSDPELHGRAPHFDYIAIALVIGSIIGYPISRVAMTAVPQRTAFSHAFGGLAAGLVGTAEYFLMIQPGHEVSGLKVGIIAFEVLLGFVTFTGSLVAFGKLAEFITGKPITYKGQNGVNLVLFLIAVGCAAGVVINPAMWQLYIGFSALAFAFGVLLVIPIGGADMPTVISLLNSYAGLSACAMGFVLNSPMLIIAGALDGSSGLILSIIMCKAMNRSFSNVLFGAFGKPLEKREAGEEKPIRSASAEEAAAILGASMSVVIVRSSSA